MLEKTHKNNITNEGDGAVAGRSYYFQSGVRLSMAASCQGESTKRLFACTSPLHHHRFPKPQSRFFGVGVEFNESVRPVGMDARRSMLSYETSKSRNVSSLAGSFMVGPADSLRGLLLVGEGCGCCGIRFQAKGGTSSVVVPPKRSIGCRIEGARCPLFLLPAATPSKESCKTENAYIKPCSHSCQHKDLDVVLVSMDLS